MAGNLIKGAKKKPLNKKEYEYQYKDGRKTRTGTFNAINDKAALRYCGFDEKGARMKSPGLLANRLPAGAKIMYVAATGKRAKK